MANITRWQPFNELVSLRSAMDRLFDESLVQPWTNWPFAEEGQSLALDVYETDDNLVVEASLPGLKPEDVDISVTGDMLTISGEMKHEEEKEEKGKFHYRERRFGKFRRLVNLPIGVDPDKAEAKFENGVLKLTLPKVEEAKPKRITVETK